MEKDRTSVLDKAWERKTKREGATILVVTLYDDAIKKYAKVSDQVNSLYCESQGIDWMVVRDRISTRAPQWDKVRAIEYALKKGGYEYVMWIDADACFTTTKTKLKEDVIDKYMVGTTEFLIGDDSPNKGQYAKPGVMYCNTGTFVVKGGDWGRKFMTHWWENPDGMENRLYHEQDAIGKLYSDNSYDLKTKMKVVDCEVMNSAFRNLPFGRSKGKDTFVLHMMKRTTGDRRTNFKRVLDKLSKEPAILELAKENSTGTPSDGLVWWVILLITLGAFFMVGLLIYFVKNKSQGKI